MQSEKKTEQIKSKALELLRQYPDGLHFTAFQNKLKEFNFNAGSIGVIIPALPNEFPEKVYKPSRGLYKLRASKDQQQDEQDEPVRSAPPASPVGKVKEEHFYEPFAVWLKNEMEDVTHAISLGGNVFKDKWGTPDVIGKKASRPGDFIKGSTEIVSAEIKTDSNQLITAFGQACAYKLFSHKSYLVVPRQAADDEIFRLDSLCQIFGIGLVTFDATTPVDPDFRILVRPSKHEPDLFYTNNYMKLIEKKLFV